MTKATTLKLVEAKNDILTTSLTKEATVEEAKELGEFLLAQEDGIGIAANQVGMDCRVLCIKTRGDKPENDTYTAFLNPEITRAFGDREIPAKRFSKKKDRVMLSEGEGCLSFPEELAIIKRYECIDISWTDLEGQKQNKRLRGYNAVVFQHELDHLDGIVCMNSPYKV